MSVEQQTVDSFVDRAVEEFRSNPLSTKLLWRLSDELPEQFCAAALRHLDSNGMSEAYRVITTLLLHQPALVEHLANPAFGTRERAVRIMRRIMLFDPSFDIRMARRLPDCGGPGHQQAVSGVLAARLLDVLDEVSIGRRLVPILGHLIFSEDDKVSAKATLFVGRRVRNTRWTAKQLAREDQRIRANAIESIWGLGSPEAISLLEGYGSDPNNRVAGNAIMGLHLLRRPGVMEVIPPMAIDGDANFRSTAAWIMGRIAKPEFLPGLNTMLKDESQIVRGAALRALIGIRRAEEHAPKDVVATPDDSVPAATDDSAPSVVNEAELAVMTT